MTPIAKARAQFGEPTPLIPRYALGVWWSRFWDYSDADLEQLVNDFAAHRMPLDVLVVDMDWHLPGHWTGYTWNRDLFSDPEAFLAKMRAKGLRVTLNLHPAEGVGSHEAAYAAMARALGADTDNGAPIPFRIATREFAEQYFALLHHPMEEQGVDFWWLDWQQGESSEIPGLDPLQWLNHLHFSDARRRGLRPLIFSRWGGLGGHRYPIGFSGDTYGGWATLASLPHFTATAANVGFGWWSHDIGSHFGPNTPEQYVRWVQFGALSPTLRLHSSKQALAERRPWAFPASARDAARAAFELRYRLVPYLYTMARVNHDTGVALCRPMYYAYPEQEAAYLARNQYLLGSDLIAAPITSPANPATGLATQDVWIPEGTWYRFDTGEAFSGPRWARISGDLATIPLFARAGAIVPLAQPALHLADVPNDWLELLVFPGSAGDFKLYEDDGQTDEYLHDVCEWTPFSQQTNESGQTTAQIGATSGHSSALPRRRAYRVTFVDAARPARVVDDRGAPLAWSYDAAARRLSVTIPAHDKAAGATVSVQWAAHPARSATTTPAPDAPFAHVISYTASDEARRQLAQVIVVPPYDQNQQALPYHAEVIWREWRPTQESESQQTIDTTQVETLLTAPFRLGSTRDPQHWAVETRIIPAADAPGIAASVVGSYINPPIQQWHVRYADATQTEAMLANPPTRDTITDPYEAKLDAAISDKAVASATITLTRPTVVNVEAWTNGTLTLVVDGAEPQGAPHPTLGGMARLWPVTRYGPIALDAGEHTIALRLAVEPGSASWFFGALLLDEQDNPLIHLTYPESGD